MRLQVENWPLWFASMWPHAQRRWKVITAYRSLGADHPELLADIAMRNRVFADNREASDRAAWIAEGRRQCALDIIKLARADPQKLYELSEKLIKRD